MGVVALEKGVFYLFKRLHIHFRISVAILFLLYPFLLLVINFPKFESLRRDMTAEYMAQDILNTPGSHSLLLLSEDTRLFNSQYLYYQNPEQYPLVIVHFGLLPFSWYREWFARNHPDIVIPPTDTKEQIFSPFIHANASAFTIYADSPYGTSDEYLWVPMGLLFRLEKSTSTLEKDAYIEENERLFEKYHDPLAGALGVYKHVMLADVLRVYGNGNRDVGKAYMKLGEYELAKKRFAESVRIQSDAVENYIELATSQIMLGQCEEAEKLFDTTPNPLSGDQRDGCTGCISGPEMYHRHGAGSLLSPALSEIDRRYTRDTRMRVI